MLIDYINKQCAFDGGFKVTIGVTSKMSTGIHLYVKCRHFRKASLGKRSKNQTHTTLSQEADECCNDWVLHVYYCTQHNHYYVKQHSACIFTHKGHLPVERQYMKLGQADIDKDVKKVAEQLLGKNAPPKVVQLLLNVMSGDTISDNAMKKMRSAVVVSSLSKEPGDSVADTLLKMLEKREDVLYCYMTGFYNEARNKIRVRKGVYFRFCIFSYLRNLISSHDILFYEVTKKTGKSKKKKSKIEMEKGFEQKKKSKIEMEKGFEHLEEEDCADHDTSVYVKNVVNALQLESGEVLLSVAIVTAEARRSVFTWKLILDPPFGSTICLSLWCMVSGIFWYPILSRSWIIQ